MSTLNRQQSLKQKGNRMKKVPSEMRPVGRPGLSLEQKLMVLVHRYRAAQQRDKRQEAARSKRLRMAAILAPTGLLSERALWLSPADTTAAANLELPTQHAGATAGVPKPLEGAARGLSANTLTKANGHPCAPQPNERGRNLQRSRRQRAAAAAYSLRLQPREKSRAGSGHDALPHQGGKHLPLGQAARENCASGFGQTHVALAFTAISRSS